MAIRRLEKDEWQAYLDRISKRLAGMRAEIEVAALNLGDQIAAEWVPIFGIVYDSKDDVLEIALDGLDHLISKPKEIYVDESFETELASFEALSMPTTSATLSSCVNH